MNTQMNVHTNFTSRNKEIRNADKIMRTLMREYPSFSTSRMTYYDSVGKRPLLRQKIMPMYWDLCEIRNETSKYDGEQLLEETLKTTKEGKNANCLEYSRMARAAFAANGYKDVKIGSLMIYHPKEGSFTPPLHVSKKADHRVLIVNAGENAEFDNPATFSKHAFIVDPWAGFTDYVSSALTKYRGTFLRDKEYDQKDLVTKFIFEEKDKLNITDKTCDKFAKTHPELVVKNKNNTLD